MPAINISKSKKNLVVPKIRLPIDRTPKRIEWYRCCEEDRFTVLEWAFESPLGLMMGIVMEELEVDGALKQAEKLLDLLREIKPPRKKPDDWEFIIKVGRDRDFEDLRIVRFGTSKLGPGEYRTKYLSIAPRDWYSPDADQRVIKRFNEEFFGGKPSFDQMAAFVLRKENFGSDATPLL